MRSAHCPPSTPAPHVEERPLTTVNHRSPRWEPEPFRWLGIRYAQEGLAKLDREAERTGRAPTGRTLVERIGRH